MRNILQEPLPQDDLRAIFAACPPCPLLPPLGDPHWQECRDKPVTQTLLAAILPRALAEAEQPLPVLTDELYTEFQRSGNRRKFETVYFERRRRLARAVFCALFAPEAESWLPVLLRAWDDIFAEVSWALPAHVPHPGGRDPFCIDLFAAETANLMGELLNVFGACAGDARREAILARLREQLFHNYLEHPEHCPWIAWTNNWNAVCHQGILGAALAVEDDAHLLARLFARATPALQAFLSGFTADGGCSEGPGYWSYGFGWFTVLNEQLETRTRGALSFFASSPLVEEIARFGRRVMLTPHRVACFADGSATDLPRASLLAYLGARLRDAGNLAEAQRRYSTLAETAGDKDGERADTFYLLRTVLHAPAGNAPAPPLTWENVYFPTLAWWISHGCDRRGTRWALAAKGGHNGEHHNHNDCGSFLLVVNGQPMLDEIGAPEYVRDLFSPKRYGFLATRTLGHSLPILNGCEQRAGEEFAARVLHADFGSDFDEFALDLTACYPPEARCGRFVRTFRLTREPFALEIRDEFERDAEDVSVECGLITQGEWGIAGGGVWVQVGGETLHIQTDGDGSRFLRGEEHFYSDKRSGKIVPITRLVFAPGFQGVQAYLSLRCRSSHR